MKTKLAIINEDEKENESCEESVISDLSKVLDSKILQVCNQKSSKFLEELRKKWFESLFDYGLKISDDDYKSNSVPINFSFSLYSWTS